MHFNILTLFPEFFESSLSCALMQKAIEKEIVSFDIFNIRDAAKDARRTVDDTPYGGGSGMVLLPEPIESTLGKIGFAKDKHSSGKLIMLSPAGKKFDQKMAKNLSLEENITIVCGRYEGFDSRLADYYNAELISLGDFVLNGGEAAALCMIEAISRLTPDFVGDKESLEEESFTENLLEYPHFTKPQDFNGLKVPDVLLSGNHAKIAKWRREQMLRTTILKRPDLLSEAILSDSDYEFLKDIQLDKLGKNLYCSLVHHPVLNKFKKTVAVSLTNLDIHDIGRCSCTYGLGGYYIVTPIKDQLDLLDDILSHWTQGVGKVTNPDRDLALQNIRGVKSLDETIEDITNRTGQSPFVVGTAARVGNVNTKRITFSKVKDMLTNKPILIVFGTGHGLAPEAELKCHAFLPPIRWHGEYNHLSVRSAVAIMLDRILGDIA